ncbi:MAG: helix-turn-helix transcriptional regulator [Oscillospiraceae bacterium]|nr:helix-turn-helix transcriptional regulator [Oscillospiraceae bacterium]
MDQQKIGNFLKTLRKEKGITQEQFAETLNVARRTVSRWETGSNMPDLALLMEIADFYEVELRELLDGERRSELMNQDTKETVMKVADLNNEENERVNRNMHWVFLFGCAAAAALVAVTFLEPEKPTKTFDFLHGVFLGICVGMPFIGLLMTSRHARKIREAKRRMLGLDREDS